MYSLAMTPPHGMFHLLIGQPSLNVTGSGFSSFGEGSHLRNGQYQDAPQAVVEQANHILCVPIM
jgi:hypothetical protein